MSKLRRIFVVNWVKKSENENIFYSIVHEHDFRGPAGQDIETGKHYSVAFDGSIYTVHVLRIFNYTHIGYKQAKHLLGQLINQAKAKPNTIRSQLCCSCVVELPEPTVESSSLPSNTGTNEADIMTLSPESSLVSRQKRFIIREKVMSRRAKKGKENAGSSCGKKLANHQTSVELTALRGLINTKCSSITKDVKDIKFELNKLSELHQTVNQIAQTLDAICKVINDRSQAIDSSMSMQNDTAPLPPRNPNPETSGPSLTSTKATVGTQPLSSTPIDASPSEREQGSWLTSAIATLDSDMFSDAIPLSGQLPTASSSLNEDADRTDVANLSHAVHVRQTAPVDTMDTDGEDSSEPEVCSTSCSTSTPKTAHTTRCSKMHQCSAACKTLNGDAKPPLCGTDFISLGGPSYIMSKELFLKTCDSCWTWKDRKKAKRNLLKVLLRFFYSPGERAMSDATGTPHKYSSMKYSKYPLCWQRLHSIFSVLNCYFPEVPIPVNASELHCPELAAFMSWINESCRNALHKSSNKRSLMDSFST